MQQPRVRRTLRHIAPAHRPNEQPPTAPGISRRKEGRRNHAQTAQQLGPGKESPQTPPIAQSTSTPLPIP
eukprot:189236-Chlamydomonas_euryale.AAC.2